MKKLSKFAVILLAMAFVLSAFTGCPDASSTTNGTSGNSGSVTYIGTKAPTEAKAVGDIVFTDGSATPYSADLTLTDAQKAAAIALIFYKGTGLNSGDDTTTSRTLGVGLKHNKRLVWCLDSAAAYEKNITTIQCPASGSAGALTFTRDRNEKAPHGGGHHNASRKARKHLLNTGIQFLRHKENQS